MDGRRFFFLSQVPLAGLLVWALLVVGGCSGGTSGTPNDLVTGQDADSLSGLDTLPDGTAKDVPADGEGTELIGEDALDPDGAISDVPPVNRCDVDGDCDDGLACTVDSCVSGDDGGSYCQWLVAEGSCLVSGVCLEAGELSAVNPCQLCDPLAPTGWTPVAQGTACPDEDPCTLDEHCDAGVCVTEIDACEDLNPCTEDSCLAQVGCQHLAVMGVACDDDDPCTLSDICTATGCQGTQMTCEDDGNDCTQETCNSETGACESTSIEEGACEDGDLCTVGDVCVAGECVPGEPDPCDDGNQCTIDTCLESVGCYHLPDQNPCCIGAVSVCDDSNSCTDDFCDPVTGECSYSNNSASCDDQKLCTENDTCDEGVCSGTPVVCDDQNPCTEDSCSPSIGCHFAPISGPECDDGLECSTGDVCVEGLCVGDTTQCVCVPSFEDGTRIVSAALGSGGTAGEALDVDGDGDLDNAFGGLAGLANEPLADAIQSGSITLLAEFRGLGGTGPLMAVYNGELAPGYESCDGLSQVCGYRVDPAMVVPETCEPLVSLPTTVDGMSIQAGGPGTLMPFSIPITDTATLQITLYMVQFSGTLLMEGGEVVGFQGILAGAVTEANLMEAIDALPPDALDGIGMTPAQLKLLLPAMVPNDVSTTGGALNAKSIGLKLSAIDGWILGVVN